MRQKKIENKIDTEQKISTELLKVDHFKMDQIKVQHAIATV
jgi:hypothetical protein